MDEDRTIEVGMLTVAEAVALRDELLTMRNERRRMRILRDTPLTDRLINTLIIELAERTGKIVTGPGTITAEQVVAAIKAARATGEAGVSAPAGRAGEMSKKEAS